MAREIAQEILRNLKVNDRVSRFELVATGQDFHDDGGWSNKDELRVTAPVEDGVVILRVMLFDSYRERDGGVAEWQTFNYDPSEVSDVAALIDGFMSGGFPLRSNCLELFPLLENGERSSFELSNWKFPFSDTLADMATRTQIIEQALKSLFTK